MNRVTKFRATMSDMVGDPLLDLIFAARTGGPTHLQMTEEVDVELTNVIEDFDRALLLRLTA